MHIFFFVILGHPNAQPLSSNWLNLIIIIHFHIRKNLMQKLKFMKTNATQRTSEWSLTNDLRVIMRWEATPQYYISVHGGWPELYFLSVRTYWPVLSCDVTLCDPPSESTSNRITALAEQGLSQFCWSSSITCVFMCLFRVTFAALVAFLAEPGLWEWWWMCWWLWWLCRSPLTPASSEPITHRLLVSALRPPCPASWREPASGSISGRAPLQIH